MSQTTFAVQYALFNQIRRAGALPWIALSILATTPVVNFWATSLDTQWSEPSNQAGERLDKNVVQILSFGHLPTMIDWIWMRILVDPELGPVGKGAHSIVYYYLDLATDLDPAFHEVYVTGGNVLAVLRNDGDGARDLLLKGQAFIQHELSRYPQKFIERYWSNAWDIQVLLAYVYLFELNDMKQASTAFQQAAQLPGVPAYVTRISQRLSVPGGEYEVGLKLINFMMAGTKSELLREQLEVKRQRLFVSQYLYDLNSSFREFLRKQPLHRNSQQLSHDQMQTLWKEFQRVQRLSITDPWGGMLKLDDLGRIDTNTPHGRVFGLE